MSTREKIVEVVFCLAFAALLVLLPFIPFME